VRISQVIGDDFESYIVHFIPPLLARIATEIKIEISEEGDCFVPQGPGVSGGNNAVDGDGKPRGDVFTIYKRGIGNVNVVYNTHEIGEKETACRCLYQYCSDIPHFLWKYAPSIVQAAAPLLASITHKSEDLHIIIGAILVKAHKMYLKSSYLSYMSTPELEYQAIETMSTMTLCSLNSLLTALKVAQNFKDSDIGMVLVIVENIADILKTRHTATLSLSPSSVWRVTVPLDQVKEFITIFRDISMIFVQKRFVDLDIPSKIEDEKVTLKNKLKILIEKNFLYFQVVRHHLRNSFINYIILFLLEQQLFADF
jgi:hypothetical protein